MLPVLVFKLVVGNHVKDASPPFGGLGGNAVTLSVVELPLHIVVAALAFNVG